MDKLVSIIIPAYNAEKWISATIQSAVEQEGIKKEIIVVDDCSTDNTLEIAKKYESKCVKIIKQRENMGASSARNVGLSAAQGDYIQWLDADDLLAPKKIYQQLKSTDIGRDSRILISGPSGYFYFRPKAAVCIPNELWKDLSPTDWILYKLSKGIWISSAAWLVSRKLTDLAGPWNEELSMDDDGEYFCRVVAKCERVKFVPEAICFIRDGNVHSLSSLSKRVSDRSLTSVWKSMNLCIGLLRSLEESERTRTACLELIRRRVFYFYPDRPELVKRTEEIARNLGADECFPAEEWKFRCLRKIVGWKAAKIIMNIKRVTKILIAKNFDRLLYILEREQNVGQSRYEGK